MQTSIYALPWICSSCNGSEGGSANVRGGAAGALTAQTAIAPALAAARLIRKTKRRPTQVRYPCYRSHGRCGRGLNATPPPFRSDHVITGARPRTSLTPASTSGTPLSMCCRVRLRVRPQPAHGPGCGQRPCAPRSCRSGVCAPLKLQPSTPPPRSLVAGAS